MRFAGLIAVMVGCAWVGTLRSEEVGAAPAVGAPEAASQGLGMAELEKLVAPIALYPDPLIAVVLPAATYPIEVVQAARFVKEKEKLKPEELEKEVEKKDWDQSVKSVALFPDAIKKLNDDLDWTTALGEAFLAQQEDVMQAVQNMRSRAVANGALQDTKEQVVMAQDQIIQILPADPEVIYVPTYDTKVVYVESGHSDAKLAATGLLSFGAGLALGAWLFNDCDWGHHSHIYCHGYPHYGYCQWGHISHYNGGRYTNISGNTININKGVISTRPQLEQKWGQWNGNKVDGPRNPNARPTPYADSQGRWQHNAEHRRGQSYKNPQAFDRARLGDSTNSARLRDGSSTGWGSQRPLTGTTPRPSTGAIGQSRPTTGTRPSTGAIGQNRPEAKPTPRVNYSRPSSSPSASDRGAFGGMGSGSSTRAESSRGNQSLNRSSAPRPSTGLSRPTGVSRPATRPSGGGVSRGSGRR